MTEQIRVEIQDREEFEKLTDHGTVYHRTTEDTVATTIGTNDQEIVFVYSKE